LTGVPRTSPTRCSRTARKACRSAVVPAAIPAAWPPPAHSRGERLACGHRAGSTVVLARPMTERPPAPNRAVPPVVRALIRDVPAAVRPSGGAGAENGPARGGRQCGPRCQPAPICTSAGAARGRWTGRRPWSLASQKRPPRGRRRLTPPRRPRADASCCRLHSACRDLNASIGPG
jgi:hypothetical protein